MNDPHLHFPARSRFLHWLMAALLVAMLFIGAAMVASLGDYHRLVAVHRPLGIAILVLAAIRLVNRLCSRVPPMPPSVPPFERLVATASEWALYTLMFVLPLVGWAMLSAGHYPIVMFGPVHLPPILAPDPMVYAFLRRAHTVLAYLLFATFMGHMTAVLFHTLVLRDGLLLRMAPWPLKPKQVPAPVPPPAADAP